MALHIGEMVREKWEKAWFESKIFNYSIGYQEMIA